MPPTNEIYRIQSKQWVFYADVVKERKNHTIFIGSKKMRNCIIIQVYKNTSTAHLQSLAHNTHCSSNESLPKKSGTYAMIIAGIHLLKRLFDRIERLSLDDNSMFLCNNNKNTPVYTSNMSFLLHGKTWYERYFDAYPDTEEPYRNLQHIYTSITPLTLPFSVLWEHLFNITSLPKNELKTFYKSSVSYQDFFNKIYKQYQCDPFHSIATKGNLLKPFGTSISSLYSSMWYIPLDKVIAKNPMKDEDITKLDRTDFPEMDWKEPTIHRMRYSWMGGFNQMYLGDEFD